MRTCQLRICRVILAYSKVHGGEFQVGIHLVLCEVNFQENVRKMKNHFPFSPSVQLESTCHTTFQ
jgi:hypothetical protein